MFEECGEVIMRIEEAAEVDIADDRPVAMRWREAHWRVIDTPTPLQEEPDWMMHPLITHPPEGWRMGWRFTARSDADGAVCTIDAVRTLTGWELRNVWA